MNFRKIIAATGVVGALVFTSACSANEATTSTPAPSSSVSASNAAAPASSAAPVVTAEPNVAPVSQKLPAGIIAKGVANDGKGDYLQTSISDDDPAMKYSPALADDAAKAHFSEADLAEAQKVIVKFIAEEVIDSTLNGGNGNIDAWFEAHKDQIESGNQPIMLADLNAGKDAVIQERWMTSKPGYAYVHGDNTPRVSARTITPTKIRYVEGNGLQGVWLDTQVFYSMFVTGGTNSGVQTTTANLSYAVAKDTADGKWKIAAYESNFNTAEG